MREAGISGLIRRRRRGTTIRVPGVRVADDLVQRGFRPAAPNVLWCADITYLETWQGRLARVEPEHRLEVRILPGLVTAELDEVGRL